MTGNDDLRERAKVEQVDRDAAADMMAEDGLDWGYCDDVRHGRNDHPLVRALAHHRLSAIEALQQRVERLEAENARLRGQIAKTANNINIAGSHYDHAITAIDEMVRQIKQDARAALGDDVG